MPSFEPTWESLQQYQIPQWYVDAKFGIFIHWGIYSVPAFDNEWYSRNMYQKGHVAYEHHRKTWGDQSKFGYKDFLPLFTAQHFDPDQWAELFRTAGARYVVPVGEHHDGFPMYDSALTDWNAARMGPKRNVLGELSAAVRRQNMILGTSSHRAEHWWFFDGGMQFDSDVQDARNAGLYRPAKPAFGASSAENWASRDWTPRPDAQFLDDWLARCCELVDRFQPQYLYFDWWIEQIVMQPYLQKFAAYYYNRAQEWGKGVVLTYKFETFPPGSAVFDMERSKLRGIRPDHWQMDSSVSYKSWCYVADDQLKSTTTLIHDLVDVVSKNGNMLLNVGPKADGTIPDEVTNRLRQIGAWLSVNGEAIYDTSPWHIFGEGSTVQPEGHLQEHLDKPFTAEDIRFTTKGNALYAICLGWSGASALVHSLGSGSPLKAEQIERIEMLGSPETLAWSQTDAGLQIQMPSARPCDHAYTFKITLKARAT